MDITAICALSVITAIISLSIKKYNSEISIIVAISGCIIILIAIVSFSSGVFESISKLMEQANINSKYITILLKAIGICFLTEFSCDCCKDAGQNALANNVSIVGKLMVLVLALPLFEDILDTSINLIGGTV